LLLPHIDMFEKVINEQVHQAVYTMVIMMMKSFLFLHILPIQSKGRLCFLNLKTFRIVAEPQSTPKDT
jgi:hypothetical protein